MTPRNKIIEEIRQSALDIIENRSGDKLYSFDEVAIINLSEKVIQIVVSEIKGRQRGWLGKEEDGSDRHEFFDEIQTIITSLTDINNKEHCGDIGYSQCSQCGTLNNQCACTLKINNNKENK